MSKFSSRRKLGESKGFTMIEILIVLGILAVMATVTAIILNPSQLIAQSRDSQRISDIRRIATALDLTKNSLSETLDESLVLANTVYVSLPDTNSNLTDNCGTDGEYVLPTLAGGWQYRCAAASANLKNINNTGWIPINFNSVTTNPLTALPVDPTNNVNYYYAYTKANGLYVVIQSTKYINEIASTDGGTQNNYFETGPISWFAGTSGGTGKYWVGGTGNWSSAASHWATSSGGSPGAGNLPTSTDNCYFDSNSFSGSGQTITVDATANCADMSWGMVTNTPTLAGAAALNVYGSLVFSANMTISYSGTLSFTATSSGKTILFSKPMTSLTGINFNGAGGGWVFQDNLSMASGGGPTKIIILTNGTLNTNGKTITINGLTIANNSNTKNLTLGTSVLNIVGSNFVAQGTNTTVSAASSTINFSNFGPGYGWGGTVLDGGGYTYGNVAIVPIAGPGYSLSIGGSNIFNNLTINACNPDLFCGVSLKGNQVINGTFTVNGSLPSRIFINSNVDGTARTLTAAGTILSNVDFEDITGAGAATWSGTSIGNSLGNSGITFTPAVSRYWVATSGGNWSATTSWSASSGGASGASVPLPQDNVFVNASSITSGGRTISADMPRLGNNIDFTGVLNSPAFYPPNVLYPVTAYGSLTLVAGMTTGGATNSALILDPHSAVNLNTNGVSLAFPLVIDAFGGTVTLQNDLTITSSSSYIYTSGGLYFLAGTFTANNKNITSTNFSASTSTIPSTIVVNMGSGTWKASGSWSFSNSGTGEVVNSGTSTLEFTGSVASQLRMADPAFGPLYNVKIDAGTVQFVFGFSMHDLTVLPVANATTIQFRASNTFTITGAISMTGASGNRITLNTDISGTPATISKSSGVISLDYLSIKDSTAAGGATWHAGANSTNVSGNSGWIFP